MKNVAFIDRYGLDMIFSRKLINRASDRLYVQPMHGETPDCHVRSHIAPLSVSKFGEFKR